VRDLIEGKYGGRGGPLPGRNPGTPAGPESRCWTCRGLTCPAGVPQPVL